MQYTCTHKHNLLSSFTSFLVHYLSLFSYSLARLFDHQSDKRSTRSVGCRSMTTACRKKYMHIETSQTYTSVLQQQTQTNIFTARQHYRLCDCFFLFCSCTIFFRFTFLPIFIVIESCLRRFFCVDWYSYLCPRYKIRINRKWIAPILYPS